MRNLLWSGLNIIKLNEMDRVKRCFAGIVATAEAIGTFEYVVLNWPDSAIKKSPDNNTANSNKMNVKATPCSYSHHGTQPVSQCLLASPGCRSTFSY